MPFAPLLTLQGSSSLRAGVETGFSAPASDLVGPGLPPTFLSLPPPPRWSV